MPDKKYKVVHAIRNRNKAGEAVVTPAGTIGQYSDEEAKALGAALTPYVSEEEKQAAALAAASEAASGGAGSGDGE